MQTKQVTNLTEIRKLIKDGAIFYISTSGGKDSQVMYSMLVDIIPESQRVVVHADLGIVEWTGVIDHIRATIRYNEPLNVVAGNWKDGSEKNLLNMIEKRFVDLPEVPSFPSSTIRFCTSDLKRDPIHKFIRRDMKARGATIGVSCIGLRAQESTNRAKKSTLEISKRLTNKSRTFYDWLPIHHLFTDEVFAGIRAAGQEPFWAYKTNERLSCVFCIFGSKNDLRHGARERPELFKAYVDLETKTGYTMFSNESLEERTGYNADQLIAVSN